MILKFAKQETGRKCLGKGFVNDRDCRIQFYPGLRQRRNEGTADF